MRLCRLIFIVIELSNVRQRLSFWSNTTLMRIDASRAVAGAFSAAAAAVFVRSILAGFIEQIQFILSLCFKYWNKLSFKNQTTKRHTRHLILVQLWVLFSLSVSNLPSIFVISWRLAFSYIEQFHTISFSLFFAFVWCAEARARAFFELLRTISWLHYIVSDILVLLFYLLFLFISASNPVAFCSHSVKFARSLIRNAPYFGVRVFWLTLLFSNFPVQFLIAWLTFVFCCSESSTCRWHTNLLNACKKR